MKKILALIMALAMVLALAACGGNGGKDETTTAPAGETVVAEDTTAAAVDATEAATGEDATATSDEASTEATTDAEGNTEAATQAGAQAGSKDLSKAEFVALLNADTAKIVKSGSYSFNRTCTYIKDIDVGGAFVTGVLNGIIRLVDKNSDVNSVVGGFLGIGPKTADYPKHKDNESLSNYFLKATALKESDLASFSGSNGVYKFTLANATNPQKTGTTPISRFTNDFITKAEVAKGIVDNVGDKIVLKEAHVDYTNISAEVTVKDGKIVKITYSCNFDAALKLSAAGLDLINGTGAAKTTNTYSNIKY